MQAIQIINEVLTLHSQQIPGAEGDTVIWDRKNPENLSTPLAHGDLLWAQRATRGPTEEEKRIGNMPEPPWRNLMRYDGPRNEIVFPEVWKARYSSDGTPNPQQHHLRSA
jgi:hypothetical protein